MRLPGVPGRPFVVFGSLLVPDPPREKAVSKVSYCPCLTSVRGRADRVVCEFTRMTLDTSANRILKAALVCCARYLCIGPTLPPLLDWLRQCDAAQAEVSDVTITDADFRGHCIFGIDAKLPSGSRIGKDDFEATLHGCQRSNTRTTLSNRAFLSQYVASF